MATARSVLWTGADPLYLSGGHGETSSATAEPPWEGTAEGKIVSRYLAQFMDQIDRSVV